MSSPNWNLPVALHDSLNHDLQGPSWASPCLSYSPSVTVLSSLCSSCTSPWSPEASVPAVLSVPDPLCSTSGPAHSLANPVSFPKENLASPSPNDTLSENPVFLLHHTYHHQGPLVNVQRLGIWTQRVSRQCPCSNHDGFQGYSGEKIIRTWFLYGWGRRRKCEENCPGYWPGSRLVDANISFRKQERRSKFVRKSCGVWRGWGTAIFIAGLPS